MKLKHENYDSTTLNRFDLLGNDEVGLAKSFAYLISCERNILYSFLRDIGITARNTELNYRETTIEIERHRDEGARILKFVKKINFMLLLNVKSVKIGLADSERNIYLHLMIQSKKCYVLLPNKKIGIG